MARHKTDDLIATLNRYAEDLAADVKRITDLADAIKAEGSAGDEVWAGTFLGHNVLRAMGSTMNTSGRISAMESAIEQAFALAAQKKEAAA
jgi:uncharacterized protein YoxC